MINDLANTLLLLLLLCCCVYTESHWSYP